MILALLLAACGGAQRPVPTTHERTSVPASPEPTADAETAPVAIEDALEAVHARSAPGRPPISDVRRDSLETAATRDYSLRLRAGWCYLVIAAGDASVSDLDLFLYDPAGFKIGWDRASDATPVVRACTSVEGVYRLRARMYAGAGDYALRVYGEATRRAPDAETPPIEIPLH